MVSEELFWIKFGMTDPIPSLFRERFRDAARWFDENGRPWSVARFVAVECRDAFVRIHHPRSPRLRSEVLAGGFRAAGVERALLVAATAGDRVDAEIARRFAAGRPDEGLFLAAYAELVATTLRRRELESSGVPLLPHYAPGYAGWEVDDLSVLVPLLEADRAPISSAAGSVLRPLRSTVVLAGVPTVEMGGPHRYWDRFGGGTCSGVCRPCTCSPRI